VSVRRAAESKTGPYGQRELATFVALGVAFASFPRGVG
jgi:hypothetical protein